MNTTRVYMGFTKIALTVITGVCLGVFTAKSIAATYKYVDENNQVHYSETPSTVHDNKKINSENELAPQYEQKPHPKTIDTPTSELAPPKQDASDAEKIAYQCHLAKQNLRTLENKSEKLRQVVDGKQVAISEQEQFALIEQQRHNTELYCP